MKLLFIHNLNNFSGSPRVLENLLESVNNSDNEISILTSNTKGFLSDKKNITYIDNYYKWVPNKILLFFRFMISQFRQFLFILFSKQFDCIYINTILPFGAGISAWLRKERIIYHIHEYYKNPNLIQKICIFVASKTSSEVIFVSNYLAQCYKNKFSCNTRVIYNSISIDLVNCSKKINDISSYLNSKFINQVILMTCSLKKYKGIFEFINIAQKCPQYKFVLVVSAPKEESNVFFKNTSIPSNLTLKNEVTNMANEYLKASIVLSLTLPHGTNGVIETFGLTLLEAFQFRIPCIATCYGGPLEIIQDGVNGFLLEPEDYELIIRKIDYLLTNQYTYNRFCEESYKRAQYFSPDNCMTVFDFLHEGLK